VWIEYMQKALNGVPDYKMPMPDGIVTLGDELYYADATPGHGFVSTVGISQAALEAAASGGSASGGEGDAGAAPAPEQVNAKEKEDIMNLFRGH
jgi:penicillin-binding protein 1A